MRKLYYGQMNVGVKADSIDEATDKALVENTPSSNDLDYGDLEFDNDEQPFENGMYWAKQYFTMWANTAHEACTKLAFTGRDGAEVAEVMIVGYAGPDSNLIDDEFCLST